MRAYLTAFTLLALTAAPAYAGVATPGEDAGVGIVAMLLVGSAYTYMRRRASR